MKPIILKWKQDVDVANEEPLYRLYVYMDNNYKQLIGYLGWCNTIKGWIFSYQIPPIQHKCIEYTNYNINEINDVLFKAILDIQMDLSKIDNICKSYCNAISDYIIDYTMGVNQDEN